jgi:hypothetical protein
MSNLNGYETGKNIQPVSEGVLERIRDGCGLVMPTARTCETRAHNTVTFTTKFILHGSLIG